MIGKVVNMSEKQGAKGMYFNVTIEGDGKKFTTNSFESVDNQTFKQSLQGGRFITYETEKNGQYTNLVKGSVKFIEPRPATDPNVPAQTQLGVENPTPINPVITTEMLRTAVAEAKAETNVDKPVNKDRQIAKAVALKATVELICAGKVEIEQLLAQSDVILLWLEH